MEEWWTKERTERMLALQAEGKSASVIAKEMGAASRNAVLAKLYRLGQAAGGRKVTRRYKWDPESIRQLLIYRYQDGLSIPEISQKLGIYEAFVRAKLNRYSGKTHAMVLPTKADAVLASGRGISEELWEWAVSPPPKGFKEIKKGECLYPLEDRWCRESVATGCYCEAHAKSTRVRTSNLNIPDNVLYS